MIPWQVLTCLRCIRSLHSRRMHVNVNMLENTETKASMTGYRLQATASSLQATASSLQATPYTRQRPSRRRRVSTSHAQLPPWRKRMSLIMSWFSQTYTLCMSNCLLVSQCVKGLPEEDLPWRRPVEDQGHFGY